MSTRHSTFPVTVFTLWALALAPAGAADDAILWDNYPEGLQNATYNMSSERNTQVIESTWVADDVDLEQLPGADPETLLLTRLVWVGARHPEYTYGTADVIVLNTDFDTMLELLDLDYTLVDLDPDPNPDPDCQTYEGEIVFDPPLPAVEFGPHFYVGVRLVGDGYFEGRNYFVTSSIDGTLRGRTEGHAKAAVFGAPDWTPASDLWYGEPTPTINFEFAFRLYSEVLCLGDLNGDQRVDLTDLSILLAHYGTQAGMTYADGDLDGDGDVDLADLGTMLAAYGSDCDEERTALTETPPRTRVVADGWIPRRAAPASAV